MILAEISAVDLVCSFGLGLATVSLTLSVLSSKLSSSKGRQQCNFISIIQLYILLVDLLVD